MIIWLYFLNPLQHLAVKSHWSDLPGVLGKLVQYYSGDSGRAMIFCDTKKDVDTLSLSHEIRQSKQKLHGDVPQASRERVLQVENLTSGQTIVMIYDQLLCYNSCTC